MPGFFYYVPTQKVSMATPEFRDGLGLSHIAEEDEQVESRQCIGPEANGLLFRFKRPGDGSRFAYNRETQAWIKCDGGKFWIGYETDARPDPESLKRKDYLGGKPVELEDGNEWTVPVISALPAAYGITNGEIALDHVDRFAFLRDDADRIYKRFILDVSVQAGGEKSGEDIAPRDCFQMACRALSANYRVGQWELAAIKALTTDNMYRVLWEVIDINAIIEQVQLKKNTDHAAPATNSGSADSPRDTPQPMQTSTG